MTPLHLAAERARVKVIEYLVGREADIINIQDRNRVNVLCVTVLHSVYYFWGFQALEKVHTLQKHIGFFNCRVVTLVADKLKRQWLREVCLGMEV